MSYIKAKEYLKKYNLEDRIMEFDESSATVHDASLRLNCSEGEIAKTLSKGFDFVRVDLYCYQKEFYFGEMTFTPCSGKLNCVTL